jgi:homogentisate 1,2-dioxygenase
VDVLGARLRADHRPDYQPPPSHQAFQGRNFVICSFCPRKLDFDPLAVPIPYHHSNLQSEEMITAQSPVVSAWTIRSPR